VIKVLSVQVNGLFMSDLIWNKDALGSKDMI